MNTKKIDNLSNKSYLMGKYKNVTLYAINWYNSLTDQQKKDAINSTPDLRGKEDITEEDKIKIFVYFHHK